MAAPGRATERLRLRVSRSRGLAAGAALTLACSGGGTGARVISDSSYVEVMAQLAYVHVNVLDSTSADSARAEILETLGVTIDQLRAYSERHGADPDKMIRVYQAIATRAESLAVASDSLSRARVRELLAPAPDTFPDSIGARLRAPRDSGGGPLP